MEWRAVRRAYPRAGDEWATDGRTPGTGPSSRDHACMPGYAGRMAVLAARRDGAKTIRRDAASAGSRAAQRDGEGRAIAETGGATGRMVRTKRPERAPG